MRLTNMVGKKCSLRKNENGEYSHLSEAKTDYDLISAFQCQQMHAEAFFFS